MVGLCDLGCSDKELQVSVTPQYEFDEELETLPLKSKLIDMGNSEALRVMTESGV